MEALIEAVGMCLPAEAVSSTKKKRNGSRPLARVDEMKLVTA